MDNKVTYQSVCIWVLLSIKEAMAEEKTYPPFEHLGLGGNLHNDHFT